MNGRIKEIDANIGISIEINGSWVRLDAGAKAEMNEENTPENREQMFNQLWAEISKQITTQAKKLGGK